MSARVGPAGELVVEDADGDVLRASRRTAPDARGAWQVLVGSRGVYLDEGDLRALAGFLGRLVAAQAGEPPWAAAAAALGRARARLADRSQLMPPGLREGHPDLWAALPTEVRTGDLEALLSGVEALVAENDGLRGQLERSEGQIRGEGGFVDEVSRLEEELDRARALAAELRAEACRAAPRAAGGGPGR